MFLTEEESEEVRKALRTIARAFIKDFRIDKIAEWLNDKLTRKVK